MNILKLITRALLLARSCQSIEQEQQPKTLELKLEPRYKNRQIDANEFLKHENYSHLRNL